MHEKRYNREKGGGGVLAWIALALATFSLWLSWNTYNMVSEMRLEDLVKEQARGAMGKVQKMLARENEDSATLQQE